MILCKRAMKDGGGKKRGDLPLSLYLLEHFRMILEDGGERSFEKNLLEEKINK